MAESGEERGERGIREKREKGRAKKSGVRRKQEEQQEGSDGCKQEGVRKGKVPFPGPLYHVLAKRNTLLLQGICFRTERVLAWKGILGSLPLGLLEIPIRCRKVK